MIRDDRRSGHQSPVRCDRDAPPSCCMRRSSMQFNHVTLIVSEFERSKAFYRSLGLIQIVDAPPRYARFVFPDGDTTLSIEVKRTAPGASGGMAELFFQCDDVDQRVDALKALG